MQPKWITRFMQMAELVASWSKDPSTQVGAVIVDDKQRVVSVGFNGFPPGVEDTPERLLNRDSKLSLTLHAEVNALSNAPFAVRTLYVTRHPCANCVLHILAARTVGRVVYVTNDDLSDRWAESIATARVLLEGAGVELVGVGL